MKLTAEALNHLLRQNPWAAAKLRPYAGKTVRIAIPPFETVLRIDSAGEFAAAESGAIADAGIRLSPFAALQTLVRPELAPPADLEGDTQLAATVGKMLRELRWDAEEDLSRLVGDIPAHELSQAGSRIRREFGRQLWSIGNMFAEYWQEEQPLLAKRRHLERFAREVDALRDDAERLAKRIERLEKSN